VRSSRRDFLVAAVALSAATLSVPHGARSEPPTESIPIYDLSVIKDKAPLPLSYLAGKVTLFVNVASYCALTPQYEGLVRIYDEFQPRGFEIIASPCDQFAHQEPGSDEEVCEFAKKKFGARFLLLDKLKVNDGRGAAAPLYVALKESSPDYRGQRVSWNFEKFLVGTDGRVLRRYKPGVQPEEIRGDIQFALEHPSSTLPPRKRPSLGVA
jgi:glutathione peroxidase